MIFKVVYGITVKDEDDKYYETILGVLEAVSEGFFPGAFLVEYLPFLWRIPSWFPGTGWQQRFLKWQNDAKNLTNLPFAYAQENAVGCKISIHLIPGSLAFPYPG